jgi:NAD(P)H-dependent FMN reductase
MSKLHVIVASTRPGRQGPAVACWFHSYAQVQGAFDAELVDLADFNLPILDEPNHPRLRKYEQEHTKAWSASVDSADAFVFVTPEYNYSAPPALVNAIDYLFHEWQYKPAGFVSYGGISGGLRSVQSLKPLLTTLKVMPIPEAVTIPFLTQQIEEGVFKPNEQQEQSAGAVLTELLRWTEALASLRAK